ncbi:MAG: hypothetical protein KDE47_00925 [Caldilineaceae bacterium]|nr:hypothetical protein [Caldilineaceae bacterium]
MIFKRWIYAGRKWLLALLCVPLLLSGCVGVDGQPLLVSGFGQNGRAESASTTSSAPANDGDADAGAVEGNATDASAAASESASSTEADASGVALAEEVRVEAGYFLFQPIAGATVQVSGETVETRGPDALPNGYRALELYMTGARITAESSPLNTMPLQTVFQVIMGDILMDGAKMGPPFEITVQDAPGMAADFTAPAPVADQPEVAGRVLMIVDESHIFMMMGLGPLNEWDASGSAQFQRVLETVRLLK